MLEGKKVSLKAVERKDLPKLLEWRNKKNFKKFFREYRILNINQQRKWFLDVVEGDKKTVMFSIILNKNQQLIGACGLTYIDWVQKNADFSIYIGDKNIYIDNVLALEAGKLLLQYGFSDLCLNRIWAEIYDFDKKKIELFKKLKFVLEGKHRETYWYNNKWHNSLFYSILLKEFKNKSI